MLNDQKQSSLSPPIQEKTKRRWKQDSELLFKKRGKRMTDTFEEDSYEEETDFLKCEVKSSLKV